MGYDFVNTDMERLVLLDIGMYQAFTYIDQSNGT